MTTTENTTQTTGSTEERVVPEGSDTYDTWIATGKLIADPRYERPLNGIKVRKLARAFDPDAIGKVYVSERSDGTFAILDGQHRVGAVRELWGDEAEVPCLVYTGLSLADEARLFVEFNEARTKPLPVDLFKAKMEAGDPDTKAIHAMVTARGFKIQMAPGKSIACVQSLQRVYAANPEALERTLDALVKAWGVDSTSVNGTLVEGLGVLLVRHGDDIADARLDRLLAGTHPRQIIAKARMEKEYLGSRYLASTVASILANLYNKGTRLESKRIKWEDRVERYYWMPEAKYRDAMENPSAESLRWKKRRAEGRA